VAAFVGHNRLKVRFYHAEALCLRSGRDESCRFSKKANLGKTAAFQKDLDNLNIDLQQKEIWLANGEKFDKLRRSQGRGVKVNKAIKK
jgi:hypothetical protein